MTTLQDNFKWFCDEWIKLKTKAKETDSWDDWNMYRFFLEEARKNFTKICAEMNNEAWLELAGYVLKQITCELKENSIKFKEAMKHEDKTPLEFDRQGIAGLIQNRHELASETHAGNRNKQE